jgi:hypothetical protein
MADINVKITAQAYERGRIKKRLSEFENDLEMVTPENLVRSEEKLRDWVRAYVLQNGGSSGGQHIFGGNIASLDVGEGVEIRNNFYGGNIAEIL